MADPCKLQATFTVPSVEGQASQVEVSGVASGENVQGSVRETRFKGVADVIKISLTMPDWVKPAFFEAPDFEGVKRAQIRPEDLLLGDSVVGDGITYIEAGGDLIDQPFISTVVAATLYEDDQGKVGAYFDGTRPDEYFEASGLNADFDGCTLIAVQKPMTESLDGNQSWTDYRWRGVMRADGGSYGSGSSLLEFYSNNGSGGNINQLSVQNRVGGFNFYQTGNAYPLDQIHTAAFINEMPQNNADAGAYLGSTKIPANTWTQNPFTLSQPITRVQFGRGFNTDPFLGVIYDLIIYDRDLTGDEYAQVVDYVNQKWSI